MSSIKKTLYGQSGFKYERQEDGGVIITHSDHPTFKVCMGGQTLWESMLDFQHFYKDLMKEHFNMDVEVKDMEIIN